MKNIVICGAPDRGKSYLTKEILFKFQKDKMGKQRPNYIFDINREHRQFKNEINQHFRGGVGINEFLEFVVSKDEKGFNLVRNSNVVFEEATAFFSQEKGTNLKLIDLLSRRFHTQNLNLLLFHSLRKVPLDILEFTDFFFLFRTKDMLNGVQRKFKDYPNVVECFCDIQQKTESTEFNREKKNYKDEYSKKWFHYNRCIDSL